MKHNIILILTILSHLTGIAQKSNTISYTDLKNDGYEISNPISDFPIVRFTDKSDKAYLATKSSDYSYDILLIFSINDTLYIQSSSLEITDKMDFKCKDPYVTYSNGDLKLECQWMKGITFATKLGLVNNQLTFIDNYQYDLNDDVYSKAELAKKENDPIAYCEAYLGAQYYSDLEYRIKESLVWAHKNALQFYKNKDYQTAASIMTDMENRCYMSTEIYDFMGSDYINIWSDVTLFYLKADLNEQCVQLSERLIKIDNGLVGVYLQYGDALYNLNRLVESNSVYSKYIDLMTDNNKKDKIPARVLERIK